MASKFGGIPTDSTQPSAQSKFGGLPVDNSPYTPEPAQQSYILKGDERFGDIFDEREKEIESTIKLARERFGTQQVSEWLASPITISDAGEFNTWADVLPAGGVKSGYDMLKIESISSDLREGKEVSDANRKILDAYIDKMLEKEVRGMSFGGKFRYYGAQMPAFMTEFVATGGYGKLAQKAVVEGVKAKVKSNVLAQVAGATARVATQTALMLPMNAKNYGQLRLAEGLEITDAGETIFAEANKSPAKTALMAYLYTASEVASELSGAATLKYLDGTGIKKKMMTKAADQLNKLDPRIRNGLVKAYRKLKPHAAVKDLFTRAGYNGMLLELGEERIADVLRETVNLTLEDGYTFEDVLKGISVDMEQLLLEGSLIATVGGGRAGFGMAVNALVNDGKAKAEAIEIVNNMTESERQEMIDEKLQLDEDPVKSATQGLGPISIDSTGKPTVKQKMLDFWDNWQNKSMDNIRDAKKGLVKQVKKEIKEIRKENTTLLKQIHDLGGINIAEVRSILGDRFETNEEFFDFVKEYNKKARRLTGGKNIIRTKGDGVDSLEIYQKLNGDNDIFDMSLFAVLTDRGTFPDDSSYAYTVLKTMFDNPDLIGNFKPNSEIVDLQAKLKELEVTEDKAMAEYMQSLQDENLQEFIEENEIEIPEGTTPQEYLLEEGLLEDSVSQEDFDASMAELNDFIGSEYKPLSQIMDEHQVQGESSKKTEEVIASQKSIFRSWYYKLVDSYGALIDLGKAAQKRGYKTKVDRLVRLYAGIAGMSHEMINYNTFEMDDNGNLQVTGIGLKEILDLFDTQVYEIEPDKAIREQDLTDYLIARRYYQDLYDMEGVKVSDKQIEDSIAKLDYLHQKYGGEMHTFDSTAQELYEYQRRVLQLLVSSGVMSQKQYDAMLDKHENYIPFQRELDAEYGYMGGTMFGNKMFSDASLSRAIKEIKGSDLDVKDPIRSMMSNTFRIVDLAWQNRVARELSVLSKVMPEYIAKTKPPMQSIEVDGKKVFRPVPKKALPKNMIVVYNKGKKEYYEADEHLIEGLMSMTQTSLQGWLKLATLPTMTLRTGATITPEFMSNNFIRDVLGSFIYSQGKVTFVDALKGLTARIGRNELYHKWRMSGGSFNSHIGMTDKSLEEAHRQLIREDGKLAKFFKAPISPLLKASEVVEQSVRIGAYLSAKKNGKSDAEAGMQSRDITIDFGRAGTVGRQINKFVPFFNAGVQGVDKMVRAFSEKPLATTMYATATITVPSILITGYYLFAAPEEERQQYLNIPQWERDLFWCLIIDGVQYRVPKPFTIGYTFGSMPERFMTWAYTTNQQGADELFYEVAKNSIGSVSPITDPTALATPLFRTYLELSANWDFFRGQNIFPKWLEDMPPEEQKTRYTSEIAMAVGEKLNYSPAKIDKIVTGLTGGSGQYVLDAGDLIVNQVKKWNGEDIAERPARLADRPLLGNFAKDAPIGNSTQVAQDFYDLTNTLRGVVRTYNDLKGEERQEYFEENKALLNSKGYLNAKLKHIRNLNRMRNVIFDDLSMTGAEKKEALRPLDEQISVAATQGMIHFINKLEQLQEDK
jgi:tRNA-dihydrouridine synthase